VYQWGAPTAEYAVPRSKFVVNLIAGILAMIPALGLLIGGLAYWWFGEGKPGTWRGLAAGALGLTLAGGIVAWVQQAYRNRGTRILLYPHGIVRFQRDGVETLRWTEIATVVQAMNTGSREQSLVPRNKFTVYRNDGSNVELMQIPKIRELGERIQQETLKYLLPPALQAYQAGKEVSFSKLTASRAGINNGKATLPWVEIKDVEIDKNGQLVFTAQGRWLSFAKVPIEEIPNVHVLLALVRHVRGPY
jgi:hypothetical protein